MKTTLHLVKAIAAFLLTGLFLPCFAQPDYVFKNAVLESGTALQAGAKYRFSNVKPGVDGLITISAMSNITLDQLDGASGFDEAFQPYINCPGKKKGYIEFTLDFVQGGTNIPAIMLEVPMTAIDIDGWEFPDEKIYEYDEFKLTSSYFLNFTTVGSQLDIKFSGGITPWVSAENKTGIVYDGIDTIQKDVMFTVVHAAVSSVTFRVGADNKSTTGMQRLRSVYFKKFQYPNGILASNKLTGFNGKANNSKVNLNFSISHPVEINSVIIERCGADMQFQPIGEIRPSSGINNYSTEDIQLNGISFYRLKMTSYTGQVAYSNLLKFNNTGSNGQNFKIFPSLVTDQVQVQFYADKKESGSFQLYDYNGRLLFNRSVNVQQGANSFVVDGLATVTPGSYVAIFKTVTGSVQQKIIKQ